MDFVGPRVSVGEVVVRARSPFSRMTTGSFPIPVALFSMIRLQCARSLYAARYCAQESSSSSALKSITLWRSIPLISGKLFGAGSFLVDVAFLSL